MVDPVLHGPRSEPRDCCLSAVDQLLGGCVPAKRDVHSRHSGSTGPACWPSSMRPKKSDRDRAKRHASGQRRRRTVGMRVLYTFPSAYRRVAPSVLRHFILQSPFRFPFGSLCSSFAGRYLSCRTRKWLDAVPGFILARMEEKGEPVSPAGGGGRELVFGIVGAAGTDLQTVQNDLSDRLGAYGYRSNPIRISAFLKAVDPSLPDTPEHVRMAAYMRAGTKLRQDLRTSPGSAQRGRGDALALFASNEIAASRRDESPPLPNTAHVLRSLKHPDEVRTLRTIYGSGFFLIGVWSPRSERLANLIDSRAIPPDEAERLIEWDEAEVDPSSGLDEKLGQRTRDTFELADVFIAPRDERELRRFLDLVFSNPFHTPRRDEHAMFMAYASSLRSGDLSRQVGAVIVSAGGDIIASGANDVPRAGGGLYWPDEDDQRDHVRGFDANARRRSEILSEIENQLRRHLKDPAPNIREILQRTPIYDLTEFGRAVHAEMDALLTSARAGLSPSGGTLYTTTFPCHNCTKHIVSAGISRVVFVEPYPKSLARELHADSIEIVGERESGGSPCDSKRVRFEQFSGIGPRRFFDLFSMSLGSGSVLRRKQKDGDGADAGGKVAWSPATAEVRIPMLPTSYIEREKTASIILGEIREDDSEE